jgi:hypothetical protein
MMGLRLDACLAWSGLPDEVQAALRGSLVGLLVRSLPVAVGLPVVVQVAQEVLQAGGEVKVGVRVGGEGSKG